MPVDSTISACVRSAPGRRASARRALTGAIAVFALVADGRLLQGQSSAPDIPVAPSAVRDSSLLYALRWRNIGPARGGRSIAVAGSPSRAHEYYFGATGGGLWKTTDGGTSWNPVTDGQLRTSSVGAVAVAESHPDVVYIGMGETELRANVMQGDGVYRSTDAGRTWMHRGLADTQSIARIRVDPTNPDLVYVAALGHPYGPNDERGVYRSRDGGATWSRVLFRSDRAGAVDLVIDPTNPRVLYATLWEVYRRPWQLWSGGDGSGLFKSIDGGDSWTELTRKPGLPTGTIGKMTVAVSPVDPKRIWVNVEAEQGGLYRSDDGGEHWLHVNDDRGLWQRAFYFLRIVADPRDRQVVYVLSFQLEKSTDGGASFSPVRTTHADHHDLWIDPNNPQRMIEGNDGGAIVSVNGGRTWTSQRFPTAQIYRVVTTDELPYHVCGAQQDNTTVCVPSDGSALAPPASGSGDWYYEVGGGESADIATNPGTPDIFYAGATNTLTRFDRRTGAVRDVQPYPRIVMGEPASAMPERWNWTYPIAISRSIAGRSSSARSTSGNRSTRAHLASHQPRPHPGRSATLGNSGGPIVFDQDGPEIYATIFSIAPSRLDSATIWTGSDDGLVHVTRDGGTSWRNVTPADLPEYAHQSHRRLVAPSRNRLRRRRAPPDGRPSALRLAHGRLRHHLDAHRDRHCPDDFVRVVREDRERAGLLFAGTEHGVYISFDDGGQWRSLSFNLPDAQVSDLVVEQHDLVIATHGRSFWILDDIEPLRQLTAAMQRGDATEPARLLRPTTAVRNLSTAHLDYVLPSAADSVMLEIRDAAGGVVYAHPSAPRSVGLHRLRWNLRYPGATSFPGIVLEGGDPARGIQAPPGRYRVHLTVRSGDRVVTDTQSLVLQRDPRVPEVSDDDLLAQFDLARRIRDRESAANATVVAIRALRQQLRSREAEARRSASAAVGERLLRATAALDSAMSAVESTLYQVANQSPKDKIAFPIRLNDRLTGLRAQVDAGDARPTDAQERILGELAAQLDLALEALARAYGSRLVAVNDVLRAARLPVVGAAVVQ